ncbi:hypothetical protein D9M69_597830 [compost metagenome]
MAHGDAGKAQGNVRTGAVQGERRTTGVAAIGLQGDLVGQADDVLQQPEQLTGFVAVIEGRDDLERLGDLLEVGLQLGFQIGIQHGGNPLANCGQTNARTDRARAFGHLGKSCRTS